MIYDFNIYINIIIIIFATFLFPIWKPKNRKDFKDFYKKKLC